VSAPLNSKVFQLEKIQLANTEEVILRGGRHLFPLLPKAFAGIKQIGVIWLVIAGTGSGAESTRFVTGNRYQSHCWFCAKDHPLLLTLRRLAFPGRMGRLGKCTPCLPNQIWSCCLFLMPPRPKIYEQIFAALKPGATLGLSHGFLLGHLKNVGGAFPKNIKRHRRLPKGYGPSVRRLYEQGKEINGAGINSSVAVEQDVTGKAVDYALGWSVALGSPLLFIPHLSLNTDLTCLGTRYFIGRDLCMVESLNRWFLQHGASKEQAFIRSTESLTGPINSVISKQGHVSGV